ncbi:MAG: UDP-N-acetylmuramoyl-L-alanyl-D-glutamate--2,6-diaminopimelate ligase [Clostridia bacterium]|nr:UDP-N-acetylmuramoyl-L-alanyl-D-glutamate--2,6-diaminopimelate ligase [Clostridia bacterium]
MKVKEILEYTEYNVICGDINREVSIIKSDNRNLADESETIFFCIKGERFDAHSVIESIISSSVAALVVNCERDFYSDDELITISRTLNPDLVILSVKDTRYSYATAESNIIGRPQEQIKCIGVTGTKGKTTTAFMLRHIFDEKMNKSIMIGTNGTFIGQRQIESARTTPEPADLFQLIKNGTDEKMESLIMEVSSLGLKQSRVAGITYEYSCFTNLYRDHIGPGEHKDMDEYFACKLLIFNQSRNAIINNDMDRADEAKNYVLNATKAKLYTYGLSADSICRAENLQIAISEKGVSGTRFDIVSPWYNGSVFLGLPGEFNVYNALCAITVAGLEGVSFECLKRILADIEIPGRVQTVRNRLGADIRVDYAHNGASLEALLTAMRAYTSGKIIVVFGCGGGRSEERRKPMGVAAALYSDYAVVTTDNSRNEEPERIVGQILEGFTANGIREGEGRLEVILDRKCAIEKAVSLAQPGDMVLIVGKGHEKVQESAGKKVPFDDVLIAEAAAELIADKRERGKML